MAHRPSGIGPTTPRRRSPVVLAAIVAAVALVGTVGAAPTRAAEEQLREAVSTTYRVDPAKAVVHVTLDITATNLKPDTAQRRFYYDTLWFDLQQGARAASATSGSRTLELTSIARDAFTEVTIGIPNLVPRPVAQGPADVRAARRAAPLHQPDPDRPRARGVQCLGLGRPRPGRRPDRAACLVHGRRPGPAGRDGRSGVVDHVGRVDHVYRDGHRRATSVVRHRQRLGPRCPDRRPPRFRRQGGVDPRLAGGS